MIKPLNDKVLVQVIKETEKATASGLILAGLHEEKPSEAIVVAIGPGLELDNGVVMKPDLNVGDKVAFAKYQGTEVQFNGEDYLILAYRDIVAVIEEHND
ncbi:MAG: co-chaperone GroES [Burkholderiaceae bacterium]|nr:co-chaperone GroES [Burkholderiaceae bacterium]